MAFGLIWPANTGCNLPDTWLVELALEHKRCSRRPTMASQDSARAIRNGERTLLPRAAGSFVGSFNENSKDFIALFLAALGESRRCEAERIIRRYANLGGDLKP